MPGRSLVHMVQGAGLVTEAAAQHVHVAQVRLVFQHWRPWQRLSQRIKQAIPANTQRQPPWCAPAAVALHKAFLGGDTQHAILGGCSTAGQSEGLDASGQTSVRPM
jgi:hypothetical protein